MLRTYALSPSALRRYLMRTCWRFQGIVTLSFLTFGLFMASAGQPINWLVAGPVVLVIALAYFLIIFLNYRQQMRLLYSVRVELDGSSIIYRQAGNPPHRVMRGAILGVRETRNGLLIETDDPRLDLFVPFGLSRDGDSEVRRALAAWSQFEPMRKNHIPGAWWMVIGGVIAALAILLFANSLWMVALLGVALFAYGTYLENRLQRSIRVVPGMVRMVTMAFTFLIFVVVMKSCFLTVTLVLGQ
jgi:hypothetical protein